MIVLLYSLYLISAAKVTIFIIITKLKHIETLTDIPRAEDIINLPNGGFLCYNWHYMPDKEGEYTGVWRLDSMGQFDRYLYEIDDHYGEYNLGSEQEVFQYPTANGKIGFMDLVYGTAIYETTGEELVRTVQYTLDMKTRADYKGETISLYEMEQASPRRYQEKGDFVFTSWLGHNCPYANVVFSKADRSVYWAGGFPNRTKNFLLLGSLNYVRNNHPNRMTLAVEPRDILQMQRDMEEGPLKSSMDYLFKRDIDFSTANPVLQINYVKHGGGEKSE